MIETYISDADLSRKITRALDKASRYWCDYFETLTEHDCSALRREGAVKDLEVVLWEHHGVSETHCGNFRTVAELIVDNSSWADGGFEGRVFVPRNRWERLYAWLRS